MGGSELAERLEQLERRVESLETHLSDRLARLEGELLRLKGRVDQLPTSEKPSDLLDQIDETTRDLLVLETESLKRDG